jgi:hypothetical protein
LWVRKALRIIWPAKGHDITALDKSQRRYQKYHRQLESILLSSTLRQDLGHFRNENLMLIVVTNYLYRPIMKNIVDALSPQGILIYETFMSGNERYGRPSNPDFLLRPNELIDLVHKKLQILLYEAGRVTYPKPALIQRICAVAGHIDYSENII